MPSASHRPPELIPRRAVAVALGGSALLVAGVALLRQRGYSPASADAGVVVARRLRFVDRADGGIDIVDADSGVAIDQAHGEQGFLRGTLRGLARERRRHGLGSDAALHLQRGTDGRLALMDPATGARIDLEAFGPDNGAVFARWIGRPPLPKERP
ncbi:MAG: photosynthetic complex assembly protein PuhC [Rubrivivax sp.]